MIVRRTTASIFWLFGDFFSCPGRTDNQNFKRCYYVLSVFSVFISNIEKDGGLHQSPSKMWIVSEIFGSGYNIIITCIIPFAKYDLWLLSQMLFKYKFHIGWKRFILSSAIKHPHRSWRCCQLYPLNVASVPKVDHTNDWGTVLSPRLMA